MERHEIFLRALCVFILRATTASSEGFPAHFRVTGVDADDLLNFRSAPNARSKIVDTNRHYQLNVEVIRASPDGKWRFVSTGERNGWVSLRFLVRQNYFATGEFPRPFYCSGTEPFWNLGFDYRGTSYSDLSASGKSTHKMDFRRRALSSIADLGPIKILHWVTDDRFREAATHPQRSTSRSGLGRSLRFLMKAFARAKHLTSSKSA